MHTHDYIEKSLELHLFFGRIMKEHALFLRAGFTPANPAFSNQAEMYKREFERVLSQAIILGNGIVSQPVLNSGELITEFTPLAEQQTEKFTGIRINKEITAREQRLRTSSSPREFSPQMRLRVKQLNIKVLRLLDGLIAFKERILDNVLHCEMFTMNYPLLIEHILREAKLYREYVETLENQGFLSDWTMKDTDCFWNQIMMEHAMFIRGLLDPAETQLFDSADEFSKEYAALLENCSLAHQQTLTNASLEETLRFRDFKSAGTQGITQCKIRSVILPLLADHVLREANHYIRLLQS